MYFSFAPPKRKVPKEKAALPNALRGAKGSALNGIDQGSFAGFTFSNLGLYWSKRNTPDVSRITIQTIGDSIVEFKNDSVYYTSFVQDDFYICFNDERLPYFVGETEFPKQKNRCILMFLQRDGKKYFVIVWPNYTYKNVEELTRLIAI